MADRVAAAARAVDEDLLVAYPTDTLYGLAARATSPVAVERLAIAKGRPAGLPISVALSSVEELERFGRLTPAGRAFARRWLPGPFTLLVPARRDAGLAPSLLAPDGSVGVRVPNHPLARELARRAGPITATSANRHGATPPLTLRGIRAALGTSVAVYLDGLPRPSGRPSQLIDLTGPAPRGIERRSGPR